MSYIIKLNGAWAKNNSLVCVGLDPDLEKLPPHMNRDHTAISEFCRSIIDATAPYVCAFKPQIAYFSAIGAESVLENLINYIHASFPHLPVILDAKRGDIGSTARMYAREAFERYKADAVTVNPYMGGDTLQPYLDYEDKGVIILCRTSNPGSGDFQQLNIDGNSLFSIVASQAANKWNKNGNVSLVVGATYAEDLKEIRQIVGDMSILVPGIGAQGGDLKAVLQHGLTASGKGLMINVSRSVIYADNSPAYAEKAGLAAAALADKINGIRN